MDLELRPDDHHSSHQSHHFPHFPLVLQMLHFLLELLKFKFCFITSFTSCMGGGYHCFCSIVCLLTGFGHKCIQFLPLSLLFCACRALHGRNHYHYSSYFLFLLTCCHFLLLAGANFAIPFSKIKMQPFNLRGSSML